MSGGELIWAAMALVLVGSALVSYRLPAGQLLKLALAWVAIFAAVFLVMSLGMEFLSDDNGTDAGPSEPSAYSDVA